MTISAHTLRTEAKRDPRVASSWCGIEHVSGRGTPAVYLANRPFSQTQAKNLPRSGLIE